MYSIHLSPMCPVSRRGGRLAGFMVRRCTWRSSASTSENRELSAWNAVLGRPAPALCPAPAPLRSTISVSSESDPAADSGATLRTRRPAHTPDTGRRQQFGVGI